MTPLAEALRHLAARPQSTGLFFDFDGTLSDIVVDPAAARAVVGAHDLLRDLATRYAVVAVVSGRTVEALRAMIGAPGVRLAGLYGLEVADGDATTVAPGADAAREQVAAAVVRMRALLQKMVGVYVEDKGLAVSVHLRRAPDPIAGMKDVEPIVRAVAAETGLDHVEVGRLVFEVRPILSIDKGTVVAEMIEAHALTHAVFAGDDTGDIAAFAAVGAIPGGIRIAVAGAETPPALRDAADYTLGSPGALVELFRGALLPPAS